MDHEDMPEPPENLGSRDRALRILVAVAMLALGLSGILAEEPSSAVRIASLVPLLTGAVGWCPVYTLFGVSTRQAVPRLERSRRRVR